MTEWWSWGLTAFGLAVMWIAGRDRRGWLLGIVWEALWVIYAAQTRQWGFLLSALVFTVVFARNYRLLSVPSR